MTRSFAGDLELRGASLYVFLTKSKESVMAAATLTSKGQITIPLEVRDAMGLSPGDRIDFIPMDGGRYAIVPATLSVRALKGIIPRPERPVTLEEMEDAIIAGATGT